MPKPPDMREAILDAATEQFAAHGFDATPLSRLAGAVGIKKSSLLYHFPSKDTLRQAVLARVLAHWNDVLPDLLAAATSGGRRFRALVDAIVAFFQEDPDRARLLLREMLDRPDEVRQLLGEFISPWIDVLADFIRLGQKEGRIPHDLDPTAYIFHTAHQIVSGIAMADVFTPLYPVDDGAGGGEDMRRRRHIDELVRIAHASLFFPRATASHASQGDDS